MIRTFALTATILLSHALATSIQAQTTPYDDRGFDPTGSGISNYGTLPNGSFGIGYTQLIPAGSLVVDQYYMVHVAPTVAPALSSGQLRSRRHRSPGRRDPRPIAPGRRPSISSQPAR